MDVLIFAQTVFYFTVSAAVIAIGVFGAIVIYHLIHIVRELEKLSRNLNNAASDAGERINDIIDRLSDLPLLSYFLKKVQQRAIKKVEKSYLRNK